MFVPIALSISYFHWFGASYSMICLFLNVFFLCIIAQYEFPVLDIILFFFVSFLLPKPTNDTQRGDLDYWMHLSDIYMANTVIER